MMKAYAIRIFVDDWPLACEFYENKLGLPLEFKDESFGWAEFNAGGVNFGIERVSDDSNSEDKRLVGRFMGVSLQVDCVEESYKHLSAQGVEFTSEPEKQDWGGVLANFKDTSGNIITLISQSA